ncbi:hypothetical protein CRYUN_Cryun31cG0075900 [Craigia yunnanensis]
MVIILQVNKIRELPQNSNIVATHTDSPDVLIWDVEAQPNCHAVLGATDSCPDLGGGNCDKHVDGSSVGPRGIYLGHEDTVEDVQFCPSSAQEFCSVDDDSCLILWDARAGSTPAVKVEKAHNADLHCVDWNPHDTNLILTGYIYLLDITLWSPDKSSVFGSSAEDGILNIWDHKKILQDWRHQMLLLAYSFDMQGIETRLLTFTGIHLIRGQLSVSDDCESTNGDGTLQIWQMIDLIYHPAEEVLAELDMFKSHILACEKKISKAYCVLLS